jgi:alcohol dehydrogenase
MQHKKAVNYGANKEMEPAPEIESNCSQKSQNHTLRAFDVQPATRLIFGQGTLHKVGALAHELGGNRILVVTDEGIANAGHLDRALEILREAGFRISIFKDVHENPSTADVHACVEIAKRNQSDLLIGLGGGSSMDTAKGCNFILTNGGRMQDYQGTGKARKPMLPLIAVPTTAGTGSECQSYALIADETTHQKMACGDPKAAPKVSILDPILTLSQPRHVTACTGMDAIAHALETAVTKDRTHYSWMHALEATKLLMPNLSRVLEKPKDLIARGHMQIGAALAGIAIENSMLGAAHAAANPLTAKLNVIHGMAVGVMLPHVIRWNADDPNVAASYAQLARECHLCGPSDSITEAVQKLIQEVKETLQKAEIPSTLAAHGVTESHLPELAAGAAQQWTGHFNPIEISHDDYLSIYQMALA